VTGPELLVPVVAGAAAVLALLCLSLALLVRRERSRTSAALAEARTEAAELRARLDALVLRLERPEKEPDEFVITRVGEVRDEPAPAPARIHGRLFADIVLRESVVKAASLGHGVRRALAPETRNRIRFEMRREVRRARKQRRAELKELRRTLQARQREQEVA
jgi:hypothetical protein